MKKDIILIGGGGHCRSCIDVIEQEGNYSIKGIIDIPEKVGDVVFDYPVIGTDDDLPINGISHYLVTIGQIKSSQKRRNIINRLKEIKGIEFPIIISPLAYVSKRSIIKNGTIVMHHAEINAGASIGEFCIINSKTLIEHDAIVDDFCHVSTGAIINGESRIFSDTFVGSNSVINELVLIPESVVIGSGTTVRKNHNIKEGEFVCSEKMNHVYFVEPSCKEQKNTNFKINNITTEQIKNFFN